MNQVAVKNCRLQDTLDIFRVQNNYASLRTHLIIAKSDPEIISITSFVLLRSAKRFKRRPPGTERLSATKIKLSLSFRDGNSSALDFAFAISEQTEIYSYVGTFILCITHTFDPIPGSGMP